MTAITWALAGACLVAAIVHQNASTAPIGEGEVFVSEAMEAQTLIDDSRSPAEGVRRARNALAVEAVSLAGGEGLVVASTSETLIGRPIDNPLLAYGLEGGRFTALASPTTHPLEIDGIEEWPAGSILYEVLSPSAGGDAVLLHYDLAELLSRRAQPGTIQPLTVQFLALGGVFALLGTAVFVGHTRAARRHRELAIESDVLREQSRKLEEANAELGEARQRAERALALAEEKMRIRSEFVLMINHELRTPLTSVVTGAELMRDAELGDADRQELIDSMVAHGKRLNEIIDQILAVARIENRGLGYELVRTPLLEACESVGATIDAETRDYAKRLLVRTDLKTLGLILASLSDNARTHGARRVAVGCSGRSVIQPMLEIGERPKEAVYFTVGDDGPGIDPDFLPRAFEKFEKNSFSSGTGLGLYMVQLMVVALGGSVAVDTSSTGSTFQIALPARVADRVMETV
ncbi:MAG TPA: HAMP domain-containing sensor histidine kinase [Acidimicrobiia bacterium]